MYVFYLNVEPSAPPKNITTMVINSTSISVSWRSPPISDQNGNIIGYQLMIIDQSHNNFLASVVNVTNTISYIASDLQKFGVYSFKVAAMTVIGLGPFSDFISNQTHQDG